MLNRSENIVLGYGNGVLSTRSSLLLTFVVYTSPFLFTEQLLCVPLSGEFGADEADEGGKVAIQDKIDNFQTHIVPIIADIDAGFGNEEATYLMAKQMIEAGACCIQIENQVSDEKQCGHQDGKVTVPHSDFLAKINAVRYAFLELGVDDGVIVARTDSLGAGLTKQIAITHEVGDLGDQYNSFLDLEVVSGRPPLLLIITTDPLLAASKLVLPKGSSHLEQTTEILTFSKNLRTVSCFV